VSEKALAGKVMKILKPLDAHRVENLCGVGTPDVNYTNGWIELKQEDRWPKRPKTPVRLGHDLQPGQRIWLTRREEKGGRAYVLLQVSTDYLLFTGTVASRLIGVANQEELRAAAIFVCNSKQLPEALLAACK
jgi:hypothetical protein